MIIDIIRTLPNEVGASSIALRLGIEKASAYRTHTVKRDLNLIYRCTDGYNFTNRCWVLDQPLTKSMQKKPFNNAQRQWTNRCNARFSPSK